MVTLQRQNLIKFLDKPLLVSGKISRINATRFMIAPVRIDGVVVCDHVWITRKNIPLTFGKEFRGMCEVVRYKKGYTLQLV